MADLIIVYWRDIPAQVIVKKGRQAAKRELPLRFTEAIDMCAMRVGARDTDAYLAEWRRADPVTVSDDLENEADRLQTDHLVTQYDGVTDVPQLIRVMRWNEIHVALIRATDQAESVANTLEGMMLKYA